MFYSIPVFEAPLSLCLSCLKRFLQYMFYSILVFEAPLSLCLSWLKRFLQYMFYSIPVFEPPLSLCQLAQKVPAVYVLQYSGV